MSCTYRTTPGCCLGMRRRYSRIWSSRLGAEAFTEFLCRSIRVYSYLRLFVTRSRFAVSSNGALCMRHPLVPMLVAGLLVAACTSADRPLASHPQFDHTQDLVGTPDLIVDSKALATSWVVYDQELKESFCTLQEGGVPAGKHRVLRFTVTTPNIGTADVYVGDPNRHWDPNGDGDGGDSDGLFENNACHRHYHFRNYATYSLLSADRSTSWISGNQGISVYYADTYVKWLGGQYFVLDGSDGQAVIPPDDYIIRIEVNPGYVPTRKNPCRFLDPATGLCHALLESNYANNVGEVVISIPDHPGKKGWGPGGGQDPVDEMIDDENRPDK